MKKYYVEKIVLDNDVSYRIDSQDYSKENWKNLSGCVHEYSHHDAEKRYGFMLESDSFIQAFDFGVKTIEKHINTKEGNLFFKNSNHEILNCIKSFGPITVNAVWERVRTIIFNDVKASVECLYKDNLIIKCIGYEQKYKDEKYIISIKGLTAIELFEQII